MSTLSEIADHLATSGLGTVGDDLFYGTMPSTPDACGVVYEYQGAPSELGFGVPGVQFEAPAVQVVFRGVPDDYDGPRGQAELAYRALATVQATALGGTNYLLITPQQAPFLLARDDARRVLIACNYVAEKRLGAASSP